MPTAEDAEGSDAPELQNVLTRYVDSIDGYTQAAAIVGSPDLAAALLEIADKRKEVASHLGKLIAQEGEKPEFDGSPEAAAHRWWLRLRVDMSDEEFRVVLAECVRGEKELSRTLDSALHAGTLDQSHAEILAQVSLELNQALAVFESALHQ